LEIAYHISKCKNHFEQSKALGRFSVNDARLSSLNYKNCMQFRPLNDQITLSFVRAAGVLAKGRMRPAGRMFDMPALAGYAGSCTATATSTKYQTIMETLELDADHDDHDLWLETVSIERESPILP
jgi:hypothetical protein